MKILYVINGLELGGAEKLVTDIVPILGSKGLGVDILLLNNKKTDFYRLLESKKCCKIFTIGKSYYNPLYVFKMIPYLNRYDILHVHLFPAQYVVALAKLISFSRTPLLFTEHSTNNRRLANPKIKLIDKFIYSLYKKIICISDEVRVVLNAKLNIPQEKLSVIQNGIDIDTINKAHLKSRSEFGYLESDKIIIMVAGFRVEKDQDTLIRSLNLLPDEYKLLLVGDGQRRKILEDLIQTQNSVDRVQLVGIRADVYALLKMSDIAVLSSHWEGFGLAAAEAMACGIPIVASNVPGLADVVGEAGLLFEKGDIEDLADKILMLKNKDFRFKLMNKGLIRSREFDIETMANRTIEVYENLLCKR